MFAALKVIHYVSLLLLCGGPFFWLAVWRPIYCSSDGRNPGGQASVRLAVRVRRILGYLSL